MKILLIAQNYPPHIGGVETVLGTLAPRMVADGHRVTVVTTDRDPAYPESEEREGVSIHRTMAYAALLARDLDGIGRETDRLAAIKRAFAPDLVHVHVSDPGLFVHLRTLKAHACPTVLTIHVRLPEKTLGERSTLFQGFAEASAITAVSHAIQLEIETIAPSIATKVSTLYFGLQEAPLAPADLNFDRPTILCVGRLVAEKGFDVAIEAFARLREQYPGIHLEIAGDGPERTNLEAQATSLSVSDGVEFLGWVDPQKVPALMNTATIVVVPSRWREALGLVAIQAAQMGRPVVASRQSGLVEAVIDGETGILVPKDRPDILAESVADLLMNPERTRTMGRRARADALERFCFDRFVSEQYDLYRRILTTPG